MFTLVHISKAKRFIALGPDTLSRMFYGMSFVSLTSLPSYHERLQHQILNKFEQKRKIIKFKGCRHSSVDSSAPSILLPRVRVPSTPSTLFSIYIVQIVNLSFELECEKNKNIQKEAGIGPFLKKNKNKICETPCTVSNPSKQPTVAAASGTINFYSHCPRIKHHITYNWILTDVIWRQNQLLCRECHGQGIFSSGFKYFNCDFCEVTNVQGPSH